MDTNSGQGTWQLRRYVIGYSLSVLLKIVSGGKRRKRKQIDSKNGSHLLLTGTFYSQNWITSQLRPLTLADGIEKARQHIEAFVVDLLELELCGELFSGRPADGNSLLFSSIIYLDRTSKKLCPVLAEVNRSRAAGPTPGRRASSSLVPIVGVRLSYRLSPACCLPGSRGAWCAGASANVDCVYR